MSLTLPFLPPRCFTRSSLALRQDGTFNFQLKYKLQPITLNSNGLKITKATLTLTNLCPFRDDQRNADSEACPPNGDKQLYLASPAISLSTGATASGAFCLTQSSWVKFMASSIASFTAGPVTLTNAELFIWTGAATSGQYDPNLLLPNWGDATLNVQVCGTFSFPIPSYTTASTAGCARLYTQNSNYHVIIGQTGTLTGLGIGWTDIKSTPPTITLYGQSVQLVASSAVVAGTLTVPTKLLAQLGLGSSTTVQITGLVSSSGITTTLTLPLTIGYSKPPLVFQISNLAATLQITGASSWTLNGTASVKATIGWSPNTFTKTIVVGVTSSETSDGAQVEAGNQGDSSDENDGLTPSTKLSDPPSATYIWPDNAFGIPGFNLWYLSLTFTISSGTPSGYALALVGYLDPTKTAGVLTGTDWLYSGLSFSTMPSSQCVVFAFDGTGTNTGISIKDVLIAKKFQFGYSSTGCTVPGLPDGITLDANFFGFLFWSTIGNSGSFLIAVKKSSTGFQGQVGVTDFTLAGITYQSVQLSVSVTMDPSTGQATDSDVSFQAQMKTDIGTFSASVDCSKGTNGIDQSIQVSGADIAFKSGTDFSIDSFAFSVVVQMPAGGGCGYFDTAASGSITMKNSKFTLDDAEIAINCGKVYKFVLWFTYSHYQTWSATTKSVSLLLAYAAQPDSFAVFNSHTDGSGNIFGDAQTTQNFYKALIGVVGVSSEREFKRGYKDSSGHTKDFDRIVTVGMFLSVAVYLPDSGSTAYTASITMGGYFDADRVSGLVGCTFSNTADPRCGGELRLNPSWAGLYHYQWNDL